ncbi:MAG: hypothetical protein ABIH46_01000 [Chloroflexota bacterium]
MRNTVFTWGLCFAGGLAAVVALISIAAGASAFESYLRASLAFYVVALLGWALGKVVPEVDRPEATGWPEIPHSETTSLGPASDNGETTSDTA